MAPFPPSQTGAGVIRWLAGVPPRLAG